MNLAVLHRLGWRAGPVAFLVMAALSPLLGRMGIVTDYGALLIGAAICYAAAGLSLNLLMGYAGQVSLGHAFFLFTNTETGHAALLYRRNDGNLGLIEALA